MKSLKLTLLLAFTAFGCAVSSAGSWGEPLEEPKTLLKMIEALEKSGDDRFTSRKSPPGEQGETYHLRAIEYIGTVERGKEKFLIAAAGFIRSSPAGRETPPARGHSYVLVFRPDFSIAATAYESIADCHMSGNRLCRGEEVVVDFDDRSPGVRHGGYLIDGGPLLPYFFADRITDEQWEDEEFMKREIEAEKASKR
jgi:hypothetical protein